LFAAGYAACFHSALKLVASKEKASLGESVVTAEVNVHPTPESQIEIQQPIGATDMAVTSFARGYGGCRVNRGVAHKKLL
jgi:organic hydroperoxide reductase OsmC/OhrA